jgi:hypothetical protein
MFRHTDVDSVQGCGSEFDEFTEAESSIQRLIHGRLLGVVENRTIPKNAQAIFYPAIKLRHHLMIAEINARRAASVYRQSVDRHRACHPLWLNDLRSGRPARSARLRLGSVTGSQRVPRERGARSNRAYRLETAAARVCIRMAQFLRPSLFEPQREATLSADRVGRTCATSRCRNGWIFEDDGNNGSPNGRVSCGAHEVAFTEPPSNASRGPTRERREPGPRARTSCDRV